MTDLTTSNETEVAARLIERLLTDPAFRARFRKNPSGACREAGLDQLADEMALGAGNAMMTLDVRESKSSLAGVMMAACMEGVGVYEFTKHVVPHLEDAAGSVGSVLSHVNLPAISGVLDGPGGGGGAAAGHGAAAAALGPDGLPTSSGAAGAGADTASVGGGSGAAA